jgi:hypothetical protein
MDAAFGQFDETPTPLDSPFLPTSYVVVVTGDLALAIRDAVRSHRQFHWVDEEHPGAHFPWKAPQREAFLVWARSIAPDFQARSWTFVVRSIAEDPTNEARPCRVTGVLCRRM